MAHDVVVADEGRIDRRESWRARCTCGFESELLEESAADLAATRHRTQCFFAQLATEARRPSYGEMQAGWTRSMLLRAQEAGLYDPTKEHA